MVLHSLQKFLFLFAIPLLSSAQLPKLCREDLPTLSVSSYKTRILDVPSYKQLQKEHDLFILGVSDSLCQTGGLAGHCCQTETLLQEFVHLSLMKGKKTIPVARIDMSLPTSKAILDKEEISFDSVPRILIYSDGRLYSYDHPYDRADLLLAQVNRLINPVVKLQSEAEVAAFLGLDNSENEAIQIWEGDFNTTLMRQVKGHEEMGKEHWNQQRLKTRAVCFIYDKDEYKEELRSFKKDAKLLAARDNLRLGLVDNQRLIKKLKSGKYGPKLFPPISMSSLVLRRYDGAIKIHDITGDDHVNLHQWINKQSLKEVEELDNESFRVQELIRQPMFIAFVDFLDPRYQKASFKAVEVLKQVAPKYSHLVGFFHVNNTLMWQRKRVLGVTWDELPAMAFNFLNDASRALPYPRGREITKEAMFDYFDDLFTGRKMGTSEEEQSFVPPSDFSKVKNDTEIEPILLNNTLTATRTNFSELVYQEGYDVMVLLITTEVINSGQRSVALQYNLAADTFTKLQEAFPQQNIGTSVRMVSYDVNVNAFPEGIDFTLDLPQILFFPAYNKRPPFKKFQGQAAMAANLLQFIEKNADIKFTYPVDISRIGYPRNDTSSKIQEQPQENEVVKNDEL